MGTKKNYSVEYSTEENPGDQAKIISWVIVAFVLFFMVVSLFK